ncbi:MAG TPA: hypothetical protein VFC00_28830 [Micromonosporaceae bacterium]|nr:hypothetical protein [Micromonosporaceae bacterium]
MIAVVGPILALADPTTMDQEIEELTEAGYGKHAPFAIHALARADRMRRDDRDHYNQAVHQLNAAR